MIFYVIRVLTAAIVSVLVIAGCDGDAPTVGEAQAELTTDLCSSLEFDIPGYSDRSSANFQYFGDNNKISSFLVVWRNASSPYIEISASDVKVGEIDTARDNLSVLTYDEYVYPSSSMSNPNRQTFILPKTTLSQGQLESWQSGNLYFSINSPQFPNGPVLQAIPHLGKCDTELFRIPAELAGSWRSPCTTTEAGDHQTEILNFNRSSDPNQSADETIHTQELYVEDTCQTLISLNSTIFSVGFGNKLTTSNGVDATEMNLYNIDSITADNADPIVSYDIYLIQDDVLFTGEESSTVEGERPSTLDYTKGWIKQ